MSLSFRLLSEADVSAVLSMSDLIETMTSALKQFSTGGVVQPVRSIVVVGEHSFFGTMPAYMREPAALGAKLVTVFGSNTERALPTHLASIVLLDPDTGALRAILDGRFITEARTAAVSAVSSRLLARDDATTLAIVGSGVQARSHLQALTLVHRLREVRVWSPNAERRHAFVAESVAAAHHGSTAGAGAEALGARSLREDVGVGARSSDAPSLRNGVGAGVEAPPHIFATDGPEEAVVGADLIALVTSSTTPVIEDTWVKPGAHVIAIGACRPTQREIPPALTARARVFVDSRAAALVESGDIVMGIQEGRFQADHIIAELGELVSGAAGRRTSGEITIFKSLGLAVEDVTAADLAYRRAVARGVGRELTL